LNGPRIRAATRADAQAIARIHVQSWVESYRGLVPDAMLEALSVERNVSFWTTILAHHDAVVVQVVEAEMEEAGTDIVGFGSAGDALSEGLGTSAEVTSLYFVDRVKRRGLGTALLGSLMRALAARGHVAAGLWVLVDNAGTRRFYEALGGQPGPTRIVNGSHGELHEVAYVWDDIARFAEPGEATHSSIRGC
jgi:GNAT superfamily N-acetyltransferase